MAAGTRIVPGDFLLFQLHGLSGAAGKHSLSPRRRKENRTGAHPQRQRIGYRPHMGGNCRELSAGRWQRGDSGGPAALRGRGPHHAEEVLTPLPFIAAGGRKVDGIEIFIATSDTAFMPETMHMEAPQLQKHKIKYKKPFQRA